jgi:hypothetical protein
MKRAEATAYITYRVRDYLKEHGYSVYIELGVETMGSRRADVLALNHEPDLLLVEVKSCAADWRSDNKWRDYIDSCNRLYLAVTDKFYRSKVGKEATETMREAGCGVMVINKDAGTLKVKVKAIRREMEPNHLKFVLVKMAFRGGNHVALTAAVAKAKRSVKKEPSVGLFTEHQDTRVKLSRKEKQALNKFREKSGRHERGLLGTKIV